MFRVKVRLVTGFLVLLLHVAVYMAMTMPLAETAKSGVEGAVQRASKLAVRSQELHNAKLSDLAQAIADRSEFGDWVLEEEETTRRTKAFDAIEQFEYGFPKVEPQVLTIPYRPPDECIEDISATHYYENHPVMKPLNQAHQAIT